MNISAIEMSSAVSGSSAAIGAQRQNSSRPAQVVREDPVSNEQIRKQVTEMQSQISRMNVSLTFSMYGERGEKIAVVVSDKKTGEVIREIPPKDIQNLYAKMNELTGMIFNRQV